MRDMAPVGHTCPKIDTVIEFLKNITWDENDDPDLKVQCNDAIAQMESIRKDNGELRTWGNEQYYSKAAYEERADDLEKELNELKEDAARSEKKINELEEAIAEMEERSTDI